MAPNIADLLGEGAKEKMNQQRYSVGSVFIAKFDEHDGVTPQGKDTYRNKIFIVLGYDTAGNAIGIILINSNINPTIRKNQELYEHQYPLKQIEHPKILKHDSFANCANLLPINPERLRNCLNLVFRLPVGHKYQ